MVGYPPDAQKGVKLQQNGVRIGVVTRKIKIPEFTPFLCVWWHFSDFMGKKDNGGKK
ncbi:MAG: hypothetical protein DDT19_02866 [Syntrophomonadaceae bacterium]|nr:hypothetical protein [Bacillota bacterium]